MTANSEHSGPAQARKPLPIGRKIAFSVATLISFFVIIETGLRLVGFEADDNVERMVFTFPIDDYNDNSPQPFLQRDRSLFWKPRSNVLGHNSLGFFGPEFSVQKDPSVYRIVCLGVSCTHFGPISYPDILRAVLDKRAPGKFEVINAGVIGYTSYQGMTLLDEAVLDWSPDLVTVYFGWNDHWLARGLQDKQQASAELPAVAGMLGQLRIYQLAQSLKSSLTRRAENAQMRVQPEDYRSNLARIHSLATGRDAKVWFLTAPHALDLAIPPLFTQLGRDF